MSQSGLTAEPRVAWPSNGISEVPFRLYTDPDAVRARAGAPVQGPHLELSLPRGRTRQTRRLRRHHDRRDRGHRRARRGRRDQRLRQPLRPSRQPAVPRARRQRPGILLHLSRLDLRPRRPAHRRRVRARREAPGRHAAGIPQGRTPAAAPAHRRTRRPGVRHVQRRGTGPGDLSRPRRHPRPAARDEPHPASARPQHAGDAEQLEALLREREGHLPRLDPAPVPDDVPDQPAQHAGRHLHQPRRRQSLQLRQARLRGRGRRLQGGGNCAPTASSACRTARWSSRSTSTATACRCRS